jgi:hypothetical protein
MLRAKEMFLHAYVSTLARLSHGFIAPRPLYTGPLCPTWESNAKGIPFLAGLLHPVALRTGATDSTRTSLQPVNFPQALILSKHEENVDRWRDKFQLLFY